MSKISVVIITYNREEYLRKAIDSVLLQDFKDLEIIVVDDGSTDNTSSLIDSYKEKGVVIKYKKNDQNLGIVKSRNIALSLSSGEYMAILDSDDFWLDNGKLRKQFDFLESNKDYGVCGSMAQIININGNNTGDYILVSSDRAIRKKILLSNQFIHSSVLIRMSILNEVGLYEDYLVGEDYDLFLKIGLVAKLYNIPEKMIAYRKHSDGITWKKKSVAAKEHLRIIKKYKGKYPLYFIALIKAYLRIVVSFF
ncbi:MAG: glycosyltransferase family 2 protein [Bacilli bacterium]|nr:glycosyltransferase family 2 protein [Bacilli bacterium]